MRRRIPRRWSCRNRKPSLSDRREPYARRGARSCRESPTPLPRPTRTARRGLLSFGQITERLGESKILFGGDLERPFITGHADALDAEPLTERRVIGRADSVRS